MNHNEFMTVFDRTVEMSSDVLISKAKEYSTDEDRLHNFKVAAALQNCTPEQAIWGMAAKHIVSLSDMVRSGESYKAAVWDEKLGDALNYLILLRAQVTETESNLAKPIIHNFSSINKEN